MPNLELHAVRAWLADWHPIALAAWPPAVRALENEGDMPVRLAQLGTALDGAAEADLERLSQALLAEPVVSDLRSLLAQFGAARSVRLLHWLTESGLPDADKVLQALLRGQTDGSNALRGLLGALRRRAVLDRIFAPERLAALESACRDTLLEDA